MDGARKRGSEERMSEGARERGRGRERGRQEGRKGGRERGEQGERGREGAREQERERESKGEESFEQVIESSGCLCCVTTTTKYQRKVREIFLGIVGWSIRGSGPGGGVSAQGVDLARCCAGSRRGGSAGAVARTATEHPPHASAALWMQSALSPGRPPSLLLISPGSLSQGLCGASAAPHSHWSTA